MTVIRGTTRATCPACGAAAEHELVQTIDPRENPADKARLLAGELNVLACQRCGKRTQLAAQLLYRDADAGFYAQVCPGGDDALEAGAAAFAASGVSGTLRVVPTQNALVEKVKIVDAGLADWAIELVKVLLLSTLGELDRVLLFESLDGDTLRWLMFDEDGRGERVSSAKTGYDRLAARTPPNELRVDRAWAVAAAHTMIEAAN
jgi:CpXC protein